MVGVGGGRERCCAFGGGGFGERLVATRLFAWLQIPPCCIGLSPGPGKVCGKHIGAQSAGKAIV